MENNVSLKDLLLKVYSLTNSVNISLNQLELKVDDSNSFLSALESMHMATNDKLDEMNPKMDTINTLLNSIDTKLDTIIANQGA